MNGKSEGPADRLKAVRGRIAAAEKTAGRADGETVLVAVSKTFDAEDIRPVLQAGQRVFGENRVQEAEAKWPGLKQDFEGVELHLIGPLQTNKIKQALAVFDVIQTVDREKLARKLAREMDAAGIRPACLVQINTGEEPQKAGVAPADADAFIALCRDELKLPVTGVMCIPPADEQPAPHFALLAKIADRNGLAVVSMGMSADFETAVQLGATHVRVGSAIFGARDYPH
ncbi:MAG: YggS family pyridoxal phosphate-dependent enzyme [Alphaproteobacteria bacterium]